MPQDSTPKSDRIGGDYKQGSNPSPGGKVDVDDDAPPYEGRTTARGESKHGGDESVARQMDETHGPGSGTTSPAQESPVQEHEVTDEVPESPHGVGESATRRGEDIQEQEGKERGRTEGPREHPSDRPTGYSDPDDLTGV
jgi:hypothetical protein